MASEQKEQQKDQQVEQQQAQQLTSPIDFENFNLEQFLKPEFYQPAGMEFGTGAIFGACAGVFSRAAARFAMISFGGFFVALQLLQSQGYINVEWNNITKDLTKQLDLNNDGKLDQEDAKLAYDRYLKTLTYKLPSSSGFALAFLLGFKGKLFR